MRCDARAPQLSRGVRQSEMMNNSTASQDQPSLNGIGGWLVLIAIGLVITPFRNSYHLLSIYAPVIAGEGWLTLTSPSSHAYHPLWAPVLLFETAINVGFAICSIGLLFLMLQKTFLFPRLFIAYLTINAFLVTIDYFLARLIPAVAAQQNAGALREMLRSICGACVWVPYMLKSKRVRATFEKRLSPAVSQDPNGARAA